MASEIPPEVWDDEVQSHVTAPQHGKKRGGFRPVPLLFLVRRSLPRARRNRTRSRGSEMFHFFAYTNKCGSSKGASCPVIPASNT